MLKTRTCYRILSALAIIGGSIVVQRFFHRQTDGFTQYKISSTLDFHPEWETPEPIGQEKEELIAILSQPYRYLAKGAQSYVFLSEDGNYVIKFFRIYHLRPPLWISHIKWPMTFQPYRLQKILQKDQELEKDFASYKIAYDYMKEETGLIYLHLNKTSFLNHTLTFYDKIGVIHHIDLDGMEFLVQKRAELVYPALANMVESKGETGAKEALTGLIDLLSLRCKKGIHDKDPDLNTNFGFIGQTPLQIDVGRFRIENVNKTDSVDRDEIILITDNLNQWLRARYPALSLHLEQTIKEIPAPYEE